MNHSSACIVVTGLPASGKSSLGAIVARELAMSCLDKDDFLERLFEESGHAGDGAWRRQLSDRSNRMFEVFCLWLVPRLRLILLW